MLKERNIYILPTPSANAKDVIARNRRTRSFSRVFSEIFMFFNNYYYEIYYPKDNSINPKNVDVADCFIFYYFLKSEHIEECWHETGNDDIYPVVHFGEKYTK